MNFLSLNLRYTFIFFTFLFFIFSNIAQAEVAIYDPNEEKDSKYILRDYSYVVDYDKMWSSLKRSKVDVSYYEEFLNKDFSNMKSRHIREEVFKFVLNAKKLSGYNLLSYKAFHYPLTNALILQNKSMLKARKLLNDLSIEHKLGEVYLVAAQTYIFVDGLYSIDKIKILLQEWLRLGGRDFEHIYDKEYLEYRKKVFSYIAYISEDKSTEDIFAEILELRFDFYFLFKEGLFDLFNDKEYRPVSVLNSKSLGNTVTYYTDLIKPEYMDHLTDKRFRLDKSSNYDLYGSNNPYYTIWDDKDGKFNSITRFLLFPYKNQTFVVLLVNNTGSKYKLMYYNPMYIDSPSYAELIYNNEKRRFNVKNIWKNGFLRSKILNPLESNATYDCSNPDLDPQKHFICKDFTLRMYDKIVGKLFYKKMATISKEKDKNEFLKERNTIFARMTGCKLDYTCVNQFYKNYIDELILNLD